MSDTHHEDSYPQLMHGDCLSRMQEIPSASIGMVLTDPPYGVSYQSNRRVVKDKFDHMEQDDNLQWLNDFLSECYRVMANNTATYMFCSWHNVDIFKQAIEQWFSIKNIIVWVKNNHGSGDLKASYAPKYELVIYAHKGRSVFRSKRVPDVMEFPKISSSNLLHPTQKNTDMLELFVRNNTDAGDTVVDPFMGSGSTGVACKRTNRKFVGIELDQGYFDLAKERILNTGTDA